MNSITHAYSVIAFLLILGCALIGFPLSVFSQSDESTTVETDIVDETNGVSDEFVVTDTEDDEGVSQEAIASPTNTTFAIDTLPREKLPSEQVFGDFVVGPGRFALELAPGESQVVELVISNRMGVKKRFTFETEDMTGSDNPSSGVTLLGDQEGPYTLRDYIKTPFEYFDLEHSERVRVPVTVSMPADAEPGGRYGSLLVSIISDDVEEEQPDGAKPGSKIISRIGTLFFITTPGEIEQDGFLKKFSTIGDKWLYGEGPIDFGIVVENQGSVHLTPFGEMRVYNMLGAEVGSIELPPWFVMPESLRVREVSWNREFLVGRYTAVATIDRGYEDIVDELSYSFWVIPWKPLVGIFIGLFLFFLLIRFIFSKFEFRVKTKSQ